MPITEEKVTSVLFVTSDGKKFNERKQAEEWEAILSNELIVFSIRYLPDLTEGRGLQKRGLIKVVAARHHDAFAEFTAHKLFGNKHALVQGVCGSNAITPNWVLTRLSPDEANPCLEVLATVQDKFSKLQLFQVGVNITKSA